MRTLQDKIKALPAARRKKIEARTDLLIREEGERCASSESPEPHPGQAGPVVARQTGGAGFCASRSEPISIFHTLRRQVEAMGGELTILATFPNGAPVELVGIGDI